MDDLTAIEFELNSQTTPESYRRDEQYYRSGAVISVVREGNSVFAQVLGSAPTPYQVRIDWSGARLLGASCDCPYSFGGYCKHIVATVLSLVHGTPEDIPERRPLDETLAQLTRNDLQSILLELARSNPSLRDYIEEFATLKAVDVESGAGAENVDEPQSDLVNPALVRHAVRSTLRSLDDMRPSEAYWYVGGVVGQIEGIVAEARPLLDSGHGREALTVLEAVTSEYLAGWTGLDDSIGEASEFLWTLGDVWAETILSIDFTERDRQRLAQQVDDYAAELIDYGLDDAFYPALDAVEQGWHDPNLQRALRGEHVEEVDFTLDPLVPLRLNVLEQQQRYDEFLNLARASGQVTPYLQMLVQLDRTDEAV